MRRVIVAASQMECSIDADENIANAEKLVKEAASKGAQIILLQELFQTIYFCQVEKPEFFNHASEAENHKVLKHFSTIAKQLGVVLPISFFEKKGQAHYNSVAVIDSDGAILGIYRKTHIPCGPGYQEKYYFNPGDTGFRVWPTRCSTIGVGICWDQWFPEAARCMALMGAEIILYPTAIGSEPSDPNYDSKSHWQICMRGHSAANMIPVIASNRIGTETIDQSSITFYGTSFITNHCGEILAEADRSNQKVITRELDFVAMAEERRK